MSEFIENVRCYIDDNLGKTLTTEYLAQIFYTNRSYLCRVFKEETGLTISDYLNRQRMNNAESLLLSTNMAVSEISLECGYSNIHTFERLFQKEHLISPIEFRKGIIFNDTPYLNAFFYLDK